ncbi:hypothetical protein GDO81_028405 [Engystomops pustulosus]|uniref:Uncharacterized protein n=1 Tax=Engystomops pustulosus TaxID=76066 RepID=A0AAV6YNA8_ENGPU|nr:hypothetical protein GDO81_028405 [Engystomops pustulosus]
MSTLPLLIHPMSYLPSVIWQTADIYQAPGFSAVFFTKDPINKMAADGWFKQQHHCLVNYLLNYFILLPYKEWLDHYTTSCVTPSSS